MSTSSVRVLFLGDASSAVRSVKTLTGSFSGLDRAAGMAAKAIAIGIVGGLALATKAAIDFDKSMRNVNSIAKLNETQFRKLSKSVLALSKETGQAPKTLADGMYQIVSSGFKANQGITILRASAKAASAGLTDTATATKAVVAALNAYHLKATDARKVSDILFETVNRGVLSFEELAQNMGDLVPAAAPLGVTLEEVGAAIATITLQGVPAAEAATRVKNTMLQLASPSKALSKLFKENGFESGEAAIKARGFVGVLELLNKETHGGVTATAALTPEIRALMGVVGLTGKNLDTYLDNLNAMKGASDGAGATSKAFAEQGKSIAFQWQRAKAALTAAAIPIGQLLFPALKKGAEAVGDFAGEIQRNMPQIRAQFGSLAGGIRDVASASESFASNRGGQAAIVAFLTGLAGARAATGVQGIVASLKTMNPIVMAIGVGFGILGGVVFLLATQVGALEQKFLDAKGAAEALKGALADQAQAHVTVRQATTALEGAQLNLKQAQISARDAAKSAGAGSIQHKIALNNVKAASDQVAQAELNRKRAVEQAATADQQATVAKTESSKKTRELTATARSLSERYGSLVQRNKDLITSGQATAENLEKVSGVMKAKVVGQYADAIYGLESAFGATKAEAAAARDAVAALTIALGHLPSRKEVQVFVRMVGTQNALEANRGSLPGRAGGRASGGFIPGVTGKSTMIEAHAGEIILNPSQQAKLGGPRFLSDLFGFGGRGTTGSFASGGIVGGGHPMQRNPHRPRRGRSYRQTSSAARAALSAVARVNHVEENLDRGYGQLARQFGISEEVYVVTKTRPGEDGEPEDYEEVDQGAVNQRLSEIDRLVASRQTMLARLDEEKAKLAQAIRALEVAIANLLKAIQKEQAAARADAQKARSLEAQIAGAARQAELERRKTYAPGKKGDAGRKARDRRVDALQDQQEKWRGQLDLARTSQSAHLDQAAGLNRVVGDFRTAKADAQANLANVLPFDRRDVELDIMELLAERKGVAGSAATATASRSPSASSGSTVGSSGLLDDLMRQVGQLRLALGIQAVQIPIIGSFARGTVHVPETGLAMVHAGERISRAGVRDGAGGQPVTVNVHVDDAMSWLRPFIRAEAIGAADAINIRIGQDADSRLRAGRA